MAAAAGADLLAVLVFAAVGRGSHAEALDPAGLLGTAAPFLVGLAAGWLASRAWRAPARPLVGAAVWVATVLVGLGLRAAFTHRLPPVFALITAVSLAVLLIGWRAVFLAVRRSRGANA
ncbi:DUF3054 family protein [Pseudonocardia eucalypti]|uniref:DUF3054 family protein n=1 Tax=Pseudonocardia eucalypti TaxID=648755 RepID=A0ABP9PJR8_9PSEU